MTLPEPPQGSVVAFSRRSGPFTYDFTALRTASGWQISAFISGDWSWSQLCEFAAAGGGMPELLHSGSRLQQPLPV